MTRQGRLVNWLTRRHQQMVFPRRARHIASAIAEMLPPDVQTLLDVGCGDGTIARRVMDRRPGLSATGADVLGRPSVAIPMQVFDGLHVPFDDDQFDAVMLVDVLHHCDEPDVLLAEVARVARRAILIKDHTVAGPFGRSILHFMDWVGNRGHGVRLVYNYWTAHQWDDTWQRHGLTVVECRRRLKLFPAWSRWALESGPHFLIHVAPPEEVPSA